MSHCNSIIALAQASRIQVSTPTAVTLAYNIQTRSGCRASEVLALTWGDISEEGSVYIKSTKRGVPHIVRMPDLVPMFRKARQSYYERVVPLTYRKLYLAYLRAGVGFKPTQLRKNLAVTHAPRHQLAREHFKLSGNVPECAGHSLGHKSNKSIQYYLGDLHGNTA